MLLMSNPTTQRTALSEATLAAIHAAALRGGWTVVYVRDADTAREVKLTRNSAWVYALVRDDATEERAFLGTPAAGSLRMKREKVLPGDKVIAFLAKRKAA